MVKEEKLQCPECKAVVNPKSLKPVIKEEYMGKGGRVDIPTETLLRGGWAGKILAGVACPKCGKIIGGPG